jgi:hypothetical protein
VTIGLAAVAAAEVAYGAWLTTTGADAPAWPTLVAAAILAVAAAAGITAAIAGRALHSHAHNPHHDDDPDPAHRDRGTLVAAAIAIVFVAGVAAALVGPTAASGSIVASNRGPFDTPYQDEAVTRLTQGSTTALLAGEPAGIGVLEKVRGGATYLVATDSALAAAPIVFQTGDEVLPLGGFTGTVPFPTVDDLAADVAAGRLHVVLIPDGLGPVDDRIGWVEQHCAALPPTPDAAQLAAQTATRPLRVYYCKAAPSSS